MKARLIEWLFNKIMRDRQNGYILSREKTIAKKVGSFNKMMMIYVYSMIINHYYVKSLRLLKNVKVNFLLFRLMVVLLSQICLNLVGSFVFFTFFFSNIIRTIIFYFCIIGKSFAKQTCFNQTYRSQLVVNLTYIHLIFLV